MPEPGFSIRVEGIDELVRRLDKHGLQAAAKRSLRRAGTRIEREVKRRTPVRTGHLRGSWATRTRNGGWAVIVGTDKLYARFVEEGTRPHEIRPRTKKVLAWPIAGRSAAGLGRGPQGTRKGKGALAFARVVKHPGTKGVHMAKRAVDEKGGEVVGLLRVALQKHLAGQFGLADAAGAGAAGGT